jgi:hypothetical protein
VQAHRMVKGIYEVRHREGLRFMIYIPSLIKIGSAIQKLIGWVHKHADSMEADNPTLEIIHKCVQ